MERQTGRAKRSVVVFDSGIGGLNLLFECVKRVPDAQYYYVSDNDNVPYGNKSSREILRLTLNALKDIKEFNPAALVVGCNTVTARCIDELRNIFPFPVVGIQPAVKSAGEVGGRCLVLATRSTVQSQPFLNLVARFAPQSTQIVGCEQLAEYIEQNVFTLPYVLPEGLLPETEADSIVLGCTHYAFVKGAIERRYGCPVFDGMAGTADHYAKIVGISDHFFPPTGKIDRHTYSKLQITFLGGNCGKNSQILKYLFENKFD